MIFLKEKNTLKRYLRYIFFISLILWILSTVFVVYQYLWSSSKQIITKGGTFVEGIFSTTSFLPYLTNDWQSKFYQGFLFNRCLNFDINKDGSLSYENNLCNVSTRDYKTYHVSAVSGYIWSDGVPFSIDDVYFTYNEILKENRLNLNYLDIHSGIEIELEGDKVKIVFKNSSENNTFFFTNYILPRHALLEPNIDMYQQSFAIEPVYNNCAKIKSQSTDQYSLIFDLSNCKDTNLGFYQIKNTTSFDNFKESVDQLNGSIVDAYIGDETLQGYQSINLESNKLVTLFFNTKSGKMTVRLRRALGGLINHNLFSGHENNYMKKYDRNIFNHYLSTGDSIEKFIDRITIDSNLSKEDLIEGGVSELTLDIKFTTNHKVFAFYTQDEKQEFSMKFNFENEYEKIAIQYNSGELYYPSSYSSKDKNLDYIISVKNNNLSKGTNNYTVLGFNGDKKEQIGTINIYNLYQEQQNTGNDKEKLEILYFDNPLSNYVIGELKLMFKEHKISDRFAYEKINDPNQLEGKLTAGEYDIFLNIIDMGLSNDISKLFGTENATINPSQYTDARLLSFLKQYNESQNKEKIVDEINKIFANDMPIVILGRQYIKLNLKESIVSKIDLDDLNIYEYNWRDEIYKNLSLTERIHIDKEKVWNFKTFWQFVKNPN